MNQQAGTLINTRNILKQSPGINGTNPQLKMFFKHVPASEGHILLGLTPAFIARPKGSQNNPQAYIAPSAKNI